MLRAWKRSNFKLTHLEGQYSGGHNTRMVSCVIIGERDPRNNNWYPARMVYHEDNTTTTTTTTTGTTGTTSTTTSTTTPCPYKDWQDEEEQDCWYASLEDVAKHQIRVGLALFTHTDGLQVVLRSDVCSTSTTTTTPAGCSGECTFTKNGDGCWEVSSSTCPAGCNCIAPEQNPPSGCATITTGCYNGPTRLPPCGTSTTTTTTTPPPGCTGGCKFVHIRGIGWTEVYNFCNQVNNCKCSYTLPDDPGDSPCSAPVFGSCVNDPSYCDGSCYWISTGTEWVRDVSRGGCSSHGSLPGPCLCDPPSAAVGPCGSVAPTTPCYVPGCDTCHTSTTTSTTTPGCNATCRRRWSVDAGFWVTLDTRCSPNCGCGYPTFNGDDDCDIVEMPCNPPTTTTTTSTSTSTTTLGPWYCTQRKTGGACGCGMFFPSPDPAIFDIFGNYADEASCEADCSCTTTTTTTTTSTSTSTTTSYVCAAPSQNDGFGNVAGQCSCQSWNGTLPGGGGLFWSVCSGPYASLAACQSACTTTTTTTTTSTSTSTTTQAYYCYCCTGCPGFYNSVCATNLTDATVLCQNSHPVGEDPCTGAVLNNGPYPAINTCQSNCQASLLCDQFTHTDTGGGLGG